MSWKALVLALGLLAAPLPALPAEGQAEVTRDFFKFELRLEHEDGVVEIPNTGGGGTGYLRGNLTDRSELTAGLPSSGLQTHYVSYSLTPLIPVRGWSVGAISGDQIQPGQTIPFAIQINVDSTVESPFNQMELVVEITTPEDNGRHQVNATVLATFPGLDAFSATAAENLHFSPRETGAGTVHITNLYLQPHAFTIRESSNPCGFRVVPPGTVVVDRLSRNVPFTVGLVAPADKLWYLFGDTCLIELTVTDAQNPGSERKVQFIATITGFSGDFPFFFNLFVAAALLVLLVLLIRRRKERLEEQILGKPQKPWLIPVEKVYLAALKRKDPRAWYVVRHYLMEDEYRSSLLWHKAYKAATKGDRRKERIILRQEARYEAWKAAWRKRIAKPMQEADAYDAKLQRKLDRKARKSLRRARRRWRKQVRTLGQAHRKDVERAAERHAKATKKAQRKGTPPPAQAAVPAPVLPPEPGLAPLTLAQHRWAKKADRYRARMARRQGDLEVRFERADARYLAALRRKVQRVARKLDDPSFVAEHPLLRQGGRAE